MPSPAVATVIAIGLVVSACTGATAANTSSASPSAAITSTASASAATASASAPPSRAAPPSPTAIVALSQVFHPLVSTWRPDGPTLLVVTNDGAAYTLVAVPFDSNGPRGPAVPLLTFAASSGFDIRGDGGALAVLVAGAPARIAVWDIPSGAGRWLTLNDPGAVATPVWSLDGASFYYISNRSVDSAIVARIPASGGTATTIATLDRNGDLQGMTPDGKGLVWSRGQEGGSADIVDIASGTDRHLADVAAVASWRARQPRILLSVGGCCAGRPGGSLVAFDDAAMTATTVAERGQFGDPAWGGASWDPTGTRIAAARYGANAPYDAQLVIVDPATGVVRELGELGVYMVRWLEEGIVVTTSVSTSDVSGRGTFIVALVSPQGGPSKTLYAGRNIGRVVIVRP